MTMIATGTMMMAGTPSSDDGSGSTGDSATMITMEGFDTTVMPSAVEAASVVSKWEASELCILSAVMEAGTAMVAVMITLAAVTLIATSDLSTPAALATFCFKLDLSLSV